MGTTTVEGWALHMLVLHTPEYSTSGRAGKVVRSRVDPCAINGSTNPPGTRSPGFVVERQLPCNPPDNNAANVASTSAVVSLSNEALQTMLDDCNSAALKLI